MQRKTILGFALLALTGYAQGQSEEAKCGNDTLTGAYGFQFTGVRPAQFVPPGKAGYIGQLEQADGVTVRVFDGKGSFTQSETSRGTTTGYIPARPGKGTYVVNPDCTLETNIQIAPGVTAELRGVVIDSGKEIVGFTIKPDDAVIRFVARRIK